MPEVAIYDIFIIYGRMLIVTIQPLLVLICGDLKTAIEAFCGDISTFYYLLCMHDTCKNVKNVLIKG